MDILTDKPTMVLWNFLSKLTGVPWSTDFVGIGRVVDNNLIGVVGYNGFTGTSCYMHMAGEGGRWMNKRFVHEAFRYPFETLKLKMVLATVSSGNTRALEIDKRFGFRELIYIPGAHEEGGIHVLQMLREECRWLRN